MRRSRPSTTAMPETDAPSRSEPLRAERTNLPVPVPMPTPGEVPRNGSGAGRFARWLRSMFGWRASSIRADLEVVLEAGTPGETGFSPEERAMLRNILGLRGRRVEDVMIPRADIVAVQKDVSLGELIK